MENEIQDAIKKIDDFVIALYKDYKSAIKNINNIVSIVNDIISRLLNQIEYYKAQGEEIDTNIIIQQLNNLLQGIQYNDQILIADTLKYEIIESMNMYRDLVLAYGK